MTNKFDWQAVLDGWSVPKEQQKTDFMEHMYQCSGRKDLAHPLHGLYTGLWQDFCVKEAGPIMRDRYFEMMEAIRLYEKGQLAPVDPEKVLITA